MKKIKLLFLLIVGVMMLALCGCEREEDSESEKDKGNNYYGNYYGNDYEEEEETEKVDKSTVVAVIVFAVICSFIHAAVGSTIMEKCGLPTGKGVGLGFFLWEIGLFICILDCIESLHRRLERNESSNEHMEQKITSYRKEVGNVSTNGDWYCTNCGRLNANYVGTCGCGTSKGEGMK